MELFIARHKKETKKKKNTKTCGEKSSHRQDIPCVCLWLNLETKVEALRFEAKQTILYPKRRALSMKANHEKEPRI